MEYGRTSNIDPRAVLATKTRRLRLQGRQLPGGSELYHLPDWGKLGHAGRVGQIRKLITAYSRDPRVRNLAISILRQAGTKPRDYKGQAAALLRWVQDPANVFYVNEPNEQLQSPLATVEMKSGDCDDLAILLASMLGAIRLSNRLVLSGRGPGGKMVRWIEGRGKPSRRVKYSHIYLCVGTPPFRPTQWFFMETTAIKPLGWDVVQADAAGQLNTHPELAGYGALDFTPAILSPEGQVVAAGYGASEAAEEAAASVQQAQEATVTPAAVVAAETEKANLSTFFTSLDWKGIAAAALPAIISGIFLAAYHRRGARKR